MIVVVSSQTTSLILGKSQFQIFRKLGQTLGLWIILNLSASNIHKCM